jgi:hypothetical protein
MSRYSKEVEEAGHVFQPIILESFGRIADQSYVTLVKIAAIKADRFALSRSEVIRNLFHQLSVTLQIRNANMVLKRDPTLV